MSPGLQPQLWAGRVLVDDWVHWMTRTFVAQQRERESAAFADAMPMVMPILAAVDVACALLEDASLRAAPRLPVARHDAAGFSAISERLG